MDSQFVIKALLITGFLVIGGILLSPRHGARSTALRRIVQIALLIAAIFAVINPQWLQNLANLVGVARGTDLMLYFFIVFFLGYSITLRQRLATMERNVTQLARKLAILTATSSATSSEKEPHD